MSRSLHIHRGYQTCQTAVFVLGQRAAMLLVQDGAGCRHLRLVCHKAPLPKNLKQRSRELVRSCSCAAANRLRPFRSFVYGLGHSRQVADRRVLRAEGCLQGPSNLLSDTITNDFGCVVVHTDRFHLPCQIFVKCKRAKRRGVHRRVRVCVCVRVSTCIR